MMEIRNAVEADLAAIVDIYNAAIPGGQATADLEPVTIASRLGWLRQRDRHYPLWVVERDRRVVGWLSFQMFYGRIAYRRTAELSIYIAPDRQQQGIGKYLLATAIARCPELDLHNLVGCIFAHNTPSLKLFARFGFEQWGYMPRVAELQGRECDLAIVGLRVVP